jgi:hypothetical protein
VDEKRSSWILAARLLAVVGALAGALGCHGHASSEPPPAAPTPDDWQVPPDSPLAQIKADMTERDVLGILGAPYAQGEYATGKVFIPFYHGGDEVRFAWRYRGIGRVIFSRHSDYTNTLRVIKVEYDPQEGGGPPPAAPPPPPAEAA